MFSYKRMLEEKDKKKLCWNCEGNVSVFEENCPYCGVYLGPALSGREEDAPAPPYQSQNFYEEDHIPPSPYAEQVSQSAKEEIVDLKESAEIQQDMMKVTIMAMGLLSLGSVFFFFGVVLFFFSKDGSFTLSWSGGHWHLYLFASIPILFAGWRFLQKVREN